MSQSVWWLIIVVIAAVVLDWWFIRWLAQRRRARRAPDAQRAPIVSPMATEPGAETPASTEAKTERSPQATEPAPQMTGLQLTHLPRFITIVQQHAVFSAAVALVIAFVAQTALTANQPALASTGYLAAALIFVFALSPFVPENFTSEALPEEPLVPAQRQPQIKTPARPTTPTLSFVRYWRYYTVANLLTGTQPDIPAESAAPESAATVSVPSPIDVAGGPVFLSTATESTVRPAQVSVWISGAKTFIEPQAVVVTLQGHVLVIDTGQRMVYRFTPNGELLGQWTVPELSPLHLHSLAVSPDGNRLYIADTANHRVQVITLT